VHEQQLNVLSVVDEESLVAGRHHVAGLLVGTETDLIKIVPVSAFMFRSCHRDPLSVSLSLLHLIGWYNVPRA
jgi:hypothetical protein